MNTGRFRAALVAACILVLLPSVGAAQKKKAKAAPPRGEPVLNALVDDIDSVSTIAAGHTRELEELKKRLAELEEALKAATADRDARAAELKVELDAVRTELEGAKKEVAALQADKVDNGRVLPRLIPSVEFRLRPEIHANRTDLDSGRADRDVFFLQRARLGLGLEVMKGFRIVTVFQDAREWGQELTIKANEKNLDLYEGYLLFPDIQGSGVTLQAGRMSLSYGAERQVGRSNWSNTGQAFDGVRLEWRRAGILKVEAFATAVRTGVGPVFTPGTVQDKYSAFAGFQIATDGLPWLDAELYAFYLDDGFNPRREKIGTVGARVVGRPVKGLVLEGEAAVQFGKRDLWVEDAATQAASTAYGDHLAAAYFLSAIYEVDVKAKPAFGLVFYAASGDADPTDARNVAYRPLFNTNHSMLGYMDVFQWTGVWDIGPTIRVAPNDQWLIRGDYHFFSLSADGGNVQAFDSDIALPTDAAELRSARTVRFRSGGSRFLGHELDLVVRWSPWKWLALEGGYSFFAPGAASKGAQVISVVDGKSWQVDWTLGDDVAHRGYLQGTVSF